MTDDVMTAYCSKTPGSARLFERALRTLPYGVTRDPVWREPHPIYAARGHGKHLIDVDGTPYLDWWNNATSLPLGHAHPSVVRAVAARVAQGLSFAAPTELEIDLGEAILGRLPHAERVRFTNSGTEAVMLAIHLARAATGRRTILKFEGAYHGFYDPVSISVTPSLDEIGAPDLPSRYVESAGVDRVAAEGTTVLPWNDGDAVARELDRHGNDVAAIVVEPVANKQGVLAPTEGYLRTLRELADRHGAVLIFDEVISFRLGPGGAQGRYGVAPDLTTLGKVIGGGLPVGAVAGTWEILALLTRGAPGGVVHMGTFNGNPMTATAGLATLRQLDDDAYAHLDAVGAQVRRRLREGFASEAIPWQVTGVGSLFKIHLHDRPLRNYRDTLPRPKAAELELVTRLALAGHMLPYNAAGAATLPMDVDDASDLAAAVLASAHAMQERERAREPSA